MTVEMAIIVPMIFLVLGIVFAYGRVAWVNANFESGVRDAARAATQADSGQKANAAARETLEQSAALASQGCADTLVVNREGSFEHGSYVTIIASCRYPMEDIFGILPGDIRVESSFTSPLDTNKELS
ncbi:TadE/TadG family type IV pilus assembly protein [Brevibacterium litoralis]|uniref:TadE/TadG family type IV pilus assembly protein n=1 Tax=Brevibacterium litoralis TaxID=3138935 RepID=UPI0032EE54E0